MFRSFKKQVFAKSIPQKLVLLSKPKWKFISCSNLLMVSICGFFSVTRLGYFWKDFLTHLFTKADQKFRNSLGLLWKVLILR